ncbi:MAG: hypothetical protein WA914_07950 [Candidatus Macondimonas sp.]|jgi:hypothetical protein
MPETATLSETEYALLVAPPLKVVAQLAASRGHRQLFDDLPGMLTLMHLVRGLTEWYWVSPPSQLPRSPWSTLSLAPLGACQMALSLAEMDEETQRTCLHALQAGYELVSMAGTLPAPTVLLESAWRALQAQEPAAAETALRDAGLLAMRTIEDWETRRRHAGDSAQ